MSRRYARASAPRPVATGAPQWGIAFAWPGCETTALLGVQRWASEVEALRAAAQDAESWRESGYDATPLEHGVWAVSRRADPTVIGAKIVVRRATDAEQRDPRRPWRWAE